MSNITQNITQEYNVWCKKAHASLQSQLKQYETDEVEMRDAFFQHLTFGTGGLRGIIGAGPNRMNIHTVAQATQGLANYLNANYENPSVAIARDSRNMGGEFCKVAARVLAANGIHAHLYPRIEPTPALSFAVRHLNAQAGICMTASHNPAEYNGYKAYGADGCQITSSAASDISNAIDECDIFDDVKLVSYERGLELGLISEIGDDVIEAYIDACVRALPDLPELNDRKLSDIKIVYTPLHGAGLECVSKIFERIGVRDVIVDEEQAKPDGNFPTCPYPNPEFREALEHSLKLCESEQPDLLIATDPDTDRVGIAVNVRGEFKLLTGNEVGVLLVDFIMKILDLQDATGNANESANEDANGSANENAKASDEERSQVSSTTDKIVMSTIVSSSMLDVLAREYGFELRRTLTGFKYIGEQIALLEEAGCESRYAFGFEESYGYLPGTYVRDKDAVATSALICNMTRFYKSVGLNLASVLESLYLQFGYYKNSMVNMEYTGAAGVEKMTEIMDSLRGNVPDKIAEIPVVGFVDYAKGTAMPIIAGGAHTSEKSRDASVDDVSDDATSTANNQASTQILPASNVLEFQLEGENKVIVRPSGTEPKIKGYLFARGVSSAAADELLRRMDLAVRELLS